MSFAASEYSRKKKLPRREGFLAEMEGGGSVGALGRFARSALSAGKAWKTTHGSGEDVAGVFPLAMV
jgi:hypothetical protein